MKVIQQYNYFPNVSAQVLAGKITKTMGLFLIEKNDASQRCYNKYTRCECN